MWPTHCAVLHDTVAVLDNILTYGRVQVSSTDLQSWTTSTPMYSLSSLTTYQSKFVLVGGSHPSTYEATNRLWSSTTGLDWETSLPAMPTCRYGTCSISGGSPEILVVAGGRDSHHQMLNVVEVLLGDGWSTVDPLPTPSFYLKSTLHEGIFYFTGGEGDSGGDVLYSCTYESLFGLATNFSTATHLVWKTIPALVGTCTLTTYASSLISVGHMCDVHCYSSMSQSWLKATSEGRVPQDDMHILSWLCAAVCMASGSLVIVNTFGVHKVKPSG